jgi:nucleotide-binding universal stress UspA family protein
MSEAIIVGTDGSVTAGRAVEEAVRLAKALGGDLHLVSAHEPLRKAASPSDPQSSVESALERAAAVARAADVAVETHAVRGDPVAALLEVAGAVDAKLIVVGNQGMHGAKRVLGSVPNAVSHKAHCNVLIVQTDLA